MKATTTVIMLAAFLLPAIAYAQPSLRPPDG